MTEERFIKIFEEILEQKLEEILDRKLEEKLDQKLDEKLDQKLDEKLAGMKADIAVLREDMSEVKTRVTALEEGQRELEEGQKGLVTRVTALEEGQKNLESELHIFRLMAENDIKQPVALLCENLYPVSQGWIQKEEKLNRLEEDMKVVKITVRDHSRQLQELKAN